MNHLAIMLKGGTTFDKECTRTSKRLRVARSILEHLGYSNTPKGQRWPPSDRIEWQAMPDELFEYATMLADHHCRRTQ